MWRSILAVITGTVVAGIVVGIIEIPGYFFHPLPPGFDPANSEALKEHMAKAPLAALVGIGIAWTIGPLVGSWIAAWVAGRAFLVHALIVATIFVLLDLVNIVSFPHPAWLAAIGVVAPLISGYYGARLAARIVRRPAGPRPYDMREKNMAC